MVFFKSNDATIKQLRYTIVSSIGESITLRVTTTKSALRWIHNGQRVLQNWNGQTTVTINNVRLADAGVYECYEDGRREEGEHAIMILIVRGCPTSKYGTNCENTCKTCWNGGVCEEMTGICVCPPGFQGEQCQTACGDSNHWGASCTLYCFGINPRPDGCRSHLFCGPNPVGCTCITGITGLDCMQDCPPGKYGANCDQDCHCSASECNPATGCTSGNCHDGYDNIACQGVRECPIGYFGDMCQYPCHCNDENTCDKNTGVCGNGKCAIGWAGADCQNALPAMFRDPLVTEVRGTKVIIDWNDWDQGVDYGTGQIDGYRVYYGPSGQDLQYMDARNSNQPITHLLPETKYYFSIAVVKNVEGKQAVGQMSNSVSEITGCIAPREVQNINADAVSPSSVVISWDESHCVITGYTIRYRLTRSDQCQEINGVVKEENTKETNITLLGLESHSTYSVSVFERSGYELGAEAKIAVITPDSVPSGPPSKLVYKYRARYQRLLFRWKEPECGRRRGNIIAYEYEFRQLLLNDTFSIPISNVTSSLSATFDNIVPYSLSFFLVRAKTVAGLGPFTNWQRAYGVETSQSYLISITTPLAILAIIAIGLVVFILICRKSCTSSCCCGCFRHNKTTSTSQVQAAVTKADDNAYEDLDKGTLERQHDYNDLDNTYLKPMSESMRGKRNNKEITNNRVDNNVCDSGTYEDIEL
ncbi:uncharacterized protein [Amphiura filiformis]|uniref:uncharacterized protein n=1 Tax=Amphiura filiformis TaxID=82378 RepID=UPI003B210D2F